MEIPRTVLFPKCVPSGIILDQQVKCTTIENGDVLSAEDVDFTFIYGDRQKSAILLFLTIPS